MVNDQRTDTPRRSADDLKYDRVAEEMDVKIDVEYWSVDFRLAEFLVNSNYRYNYRGLQVLLRYTMLKFIYLTCTNAYQFEIELFLHDFCGKYK